MDGKSSQEYPFKSLGTKDSIRSSTLFLLYVNKLPDDVILDIAICADDTSDIFRGFLGILLPAK